MVTFLFMVAVINKKLFFPQSLVLHTRNSQVRRKILSGGNQLQHSQIILCDFTPSMLCKIIDIIPQSHSFSRHITLPSRIEARHIFCSRKIYEANTILSLFKAIYPYQKKGF